MSARSVAGALVLLLLTACHAQPAASSGPASCAEVAQHVRALMPPGDEHANQVRDVLAERCRADRWPVAATNCMMDEHELHAGHHCQDQLTAEQRSAFVRAVDAIDAPPPPPKAEAATGGLPRECMDYEDAVQQFAACGKLPPGTIDAMKDAFAHQIQAMSALPADQRANIAASCKQAAEAVRQATAACTP